MINALRNIEKTNQRPSKNTLIYLLQIRELHASLLFLLGECEYELLGGDLENIVDKRHTLLRREREILKKWIPNILDSIEKEKIE